MSEDMIASLIKGKSPEFVLGVKAWAQSEDDNPWITCSQRGWDWCQGQCEAYTLSSKIGYYEMNELVQAMP